MFRPLELFIGLRYTRAKRRNHFISFISFTSMVGIALGVAALIVVLSVMNGFEYEVRTRILGMTAHANISGYGDPIDNWRELADFARTHPEVRGAAPYVQAEGMLTHGSRVRGAMLQGVLPEAEPMVSLIGTKITQGRLDALRPDASGIILGEELARLLGVKAGDKITLVTPSPVSSASGILPSVRRFTVIGEFRVGMHEYDSAVALIHMEEAQKLLGIGEGVSGVRLKVDDLFRAPLVARDLREVLPGFYEVGDWTWRHANLFRAIVSQKSMMFIILLLIVAVAAFNIVSTLVMVVTDKESDIAILRTLGASPRSILLVFMVQGTLIGVIGTLAGLAGGVAIALNVENIVPAIERLFEIRFLAPDVYPISDLPSELRWADVAKICGVSFLLSVVATLYPAWRASRTQPAEALRYD